MRLFYAIDLDEPARAAVARSIVALRHEAEARGASLRWVAPPKLHVTLAFLGEVPADRLGRLRDIAAESFEHAPFGCSLSVPGVFPAAGAPRLVWIGPARGHAEVARINRLVWQRLDGAGWGPAPATFEPHVTLGRVQRRRAGAARDLRALVAGTSLPAVDWTVDHVSLYESRRSDRGATYHRMAVARLGGGAP